MTDHTGPYKIKCLENEIVDEIGVMDFPKNPNVLLGSDGLCVTIVTQINPGSVMNSSLKM